MEQETTCSKTTEELNAMRVEERKSICLSKDDCRDGDTCLPTELAHPARSSIEEGTKNPCNECPCGHWQRLPTRCPTCNRSWPMKQGHECFFCENKKRLEAKNGSKNR